MNNKGLIAVITCLVIISLIAIVVSLIYWVKMRIVRSKFDEFRLYHSKFLVMYVDTAKQNRKNVLLIHKLNYAINDSLFKAQHMTIKQVQEWKDKYNLPNNCYSAYDISNENIVREVVTQDVKIVKDYEESIHNPA